MTKPQTIDCHPLNEPVLTYAPGSAERRELRSALAAQRRHIEDIPLVIGGRRVLGDVQTEVVAPHRHSQVLARVASASAAQAKAAVQAALAARDAWAQTTLQRRADIFLRAADLLAGPWRQRINAATMLGQSKTVHQAEIDGACELIDFLRFNVHFARGIAGTQPLSITGVDNRTDYRPLEGFVCAITPFNFTAIAGNLAAAPALMGNTVVWKPASTAALSNYLFMQVLEEAGLPPGVINFLPGDPRQIGETLMGSPHLAGVHFTGSTAVFDELWLEAAKNLRVYRSYPRLVGETGGKDFVVAHASADVEALAVGLVRGAFEYQGQKCSAASRAYVPASLWPALLTRLQALIAELKMGDVEDFGNFVGAVIDRRAFTRLSDAVARANSDPGVEVLAGGAPDDRVGFFVPPTLVRVNDPRHALMRHELFGPLLSLYVYPDDAWHETLALVDETSGYALTGAVFAQDRAALAEADEALRFAAGNFYVNDKPTGAVVGQQPFGGARRSGTNDKAGSALNLLRWVSPRTVKTTAAPARDHRYPHMAPDPADHANA